MSVNIIAAIGLNRELGHENKLLCHLSDDLKHFKKLTEGNYCLMGRRTYDSLGKPLKNRHNIILTRNKKYKAPVGTFVYNDLETVIEKYHNHNNATNELFIIGGGILFEQAIHYADKLYLTIIQHSFSEADSYFPEFELSDWDHKITGFKKADDKNEFDHYYVEYTRKKTKDN